MSKYKPPKGTKDYNAYDIATRDKLLEICKQNCQLIGTKQIETPAFELKSVLFEKYENAENETEKLVFELSNKDEETKKEQCALRFDMTVPWSRYVKGSGIKKMTRYQYGRVYRRDQPNMKAGRFREFYQFDFDILGQSVDIPMANAETLALLYRILTQIQNTCGLKKQFVIRINSRPILKNMFKLAGIDDALFMTVCSSIDKLDKMSWKNVAQELQTKGVKESSIEKLGEFLKTFKAKSVKWDDLENIECVPKETWAIFRTIRQTLPLLIGDRLIGNDVDDFDKIFQIDFSLARGLDYYTGMIFEVVLKKSKVGSIAGGGRYDNLCGGIPCVGFALGLDRLLAVLDRPKKRKLAVDVWIIQINKVVYNSPEDGDNGNDDNNNNANDKCTSSKLYIKRLQLLGILRNQGIKTATEFSEIPGLGGQIKYVLKKGIPFAMFIGEQEFLNGTVTLKDIDKKTQKTMSLQEAIDIIKQKIL